eukprot:Skav220301  [mRNA]  locus=scaffold3050:41473:44172:- [translate_table: standard]
MLREHDPIHSLLPGVFRHPDADYIRTLQFSLPEAHLQLTHVRGGIFTDGSCKHPQSPHTRWAAYAVVYPVSDMDDIVRDAMLPIDQMLATHFSVAGLALLPGVQTIPRAELFAAVQAHEAQLVSDTEDIVYTDSSYVLQVRTLVRNTPQVETLHKCRNYDLIRRWHYLCWGRGRNLPTTKVKAHQVIPGPSPWDTWVRIGNAVADHVAKTAAHTLMPAYTAALTTMNQEEKTATQSFHSQLVLRQELALFRKQLEKQSDNREQFDPEQTLRKFQQWNLAESYHPQVSEEDFWVLDLSRWGTGFTHLLLQWLATLSFAPQEDPDDCGITWLELLFNFWLQTQTDVPLKLDGHYRMVADTMHWAREQFTVNDAIVSFSGAIKHLEFMLQRDLLPPVRGQQISSLYKLGGGCHKLGLTKRPMMPLQSESMSWVWEFLTSHHAGGRTQFDRMPVIPERIPSIQTSKVPPSGDTHEARELRYEEELAQNFRNGLLVPGMAAIPGSGVDLAPDAKTVPLPSVFCENIRRLWRNWGSCATKGGDFLNWADMNINLYPVCNAKAMVL